VTWLSVPSASVFDGSPGAISDLLLDALDRRHRVLAVAHDDDTPDRLGAALVSTPRAARAERDFGDVADAQIGCPSRAVMAVLLEVLDRLR
jgi:hypothetical protein